MQSDKILFSFNHNRSIVFIIDTIDNLYLWCTGLYIDYDYTRAGDSPINLFFT